MKIIVTIKNNDNISSNKNSTINKDNVTLPPPSQNSKQTKFKLADSMVKKLNGFYRQENSIIRPSNSAKIRCMHDHVKPAVQDFNPDHIILQCGTNDLSSERTAPI